MKRWKHIPFQYAEVSEGGRKHSANIAQSHLTKTPLVILLPWMGASNKAIARYNNIYHDLGCRTVTHRVQLSHFLWPKNGLAHSRKLLMELKSEVEQSDCQLIIHSMSIGSYFYCLMLMSLEKEPEMFKSVFSNLSCQVIDSPVVGTLREMATGIAITTTNYKSMQVVLQQLILAYFCVTKSHSVHYYEKAIEVIKHRSPVIPTVLMTSEHDPMALPHSFQEFVHAFEKQGLHVISRTWERSEHAQHLRYYPKEYVEIIQNLLRKSGMLSN